MTIDGGVAAPLYELGKTSADEWAAMQKSSAPFGEITGKHIIFSLQTDVLARVGDPAALLNYWDKVIEAEADFAGWPAQPATPERLAVDREISSGSKHSGYPIMAHLESQRAMIHLDTLNKDGEWGTFHELGHNHQAGAFTFGPDFGEVTVNLFTLYAMHKIVSIELAGHPAIRDINKLYADRLAAEPKIDPFSNLVIYIKTIQAFGWDPLHETLKTYALPNGAAGLKERQEKIDQWVLRYSRATKHNLAEYYGRFDLKCSKTIVDQLKDLPTWEPEDTAVEPLPNGKN